MNALLSISIAYITDLSITFAPSELIQKMGLRRLARRVSRENLVKFYPYLFCGLASAPYPLPIPYFSFFRLSLRLSDCAKIAP